ncbi:MAG: type II secretion system major pseudopilin GspG [Deltaproteobacteria bacterium]|nr:type II secretion system major pseudopilin GspG [Deltaproteobacteria bacterium]
MRRKADDRGFTLIELMVVIVILGILAGLIIPRVMGRPDEARIAKAKMQIESLETALKLYKLDSGTYPTTEQGLQALVEAPSVGQPARNWRTGGYLERSRVPKDPWGNDFIYLSPGAHGDFDLSSMGADGEVGGEEKNRDINSWELE